MQILFVIFTLPITEIIKEKELREILVAYKTVLILLQKWCTEWAKYHSFSRLETPRLKNIIKSTP